MTGTTIPPIPDNTDLTGEGESNTVDGVLYTGCLPSKLTKYLNYPQLWERGHPVIIASGPRFLRRHNGTDINAFLANCRFCLVAVQREKSLIVVMSWAKK